MTKRVLINKGFYDDPQRFLGKKFKKREDFIKSNDIVEVWFDSGSTHSFCFREKKRFKMASLNVPGGSDQHQDGFILLSRVLRYKIERLLIVYYLTAFVVDGKGMKMSKSAGNIISRNRF